jgi:hypothetical protein
MYKSMTKISLLAIVGITAVVTTSCGASKMTQCNSIAKVTKDAEAAATKFADSSKKTNDPAVAAKSLTDMSTKSQEFGKVMQALAIKDEKLTGFQSRFVTMYQDYDKLFAQMSAATQAKNAQASNKTIGEIQAASAKEDVLVKELTAYCTGK